MIKVLVEGKIRIIRNKQIDYFTENDLSCKYKKCTINISKQEVGDYWVSVTDKNGGYLVYGGFGGEYCRYQIKTIEDCLIMCIQNILI